MKYVCEPPKNVIHKLVKHIGVRRFPGILMIFDDVETYRETMNILAKNKNTKPVLISDVAGDPFEDFTRKLKELLRRSSGVFFMPEISPLSWFKTNQGGFIVNLLSLEIIKDIILIIPVIGLSPEALYTLERFEKMEKGRRDSDFILRFKRVGEKLKIHRLNFNPIPDGIHCFRNFKELLRIFEKCEIPGEIHISFDLKQREFVSGIEYVVIENLKEFLHVKGFSTPLEYSNEQQKYWENLFNDFEKMGISDFEKYVFEILNILRFDLDVFEKWEGEYRSWLIHGLLRSLEDIPTFLKKVAIDSKDYNEFERKLWMIPFESNLVEEDCKLRRTVLKKMDSDPPKEYLEKMESNLPENPDVFVGVKGEYPFILKWVKRTLDHVKTSELIETLRGIYPDLASYMSILLLNIPDYFKKYVVAKLKNDFSDLESIDLSSEKFKSKSRDGLVSNSKLKTVYIDGMGVEWLGYLVDKLEENSKIEWEIARVNLPTTSEFNSLDAEDISERRLDKVLHENGYPMNIVESLEVMKYLIERIRKMVDENGEVMLTSDHGFTSFIENSKLELPPGAIPKRYGRYAEISNTCSDTKYYLCVKYERKNFLVAKTHRSFKSKGSPEGEIHGGATPEEMYVPVLTLSVHREKAPFKVELLNNDVMEFEKLKIRIEPSVSVRSVVMECEGKIIHGDREDDVFVFDVRNLNAGEKTGRIMINSEYSNDVKFHLIKGSEEEELF
ncbi:MAG: BREX-4 system phosphatase PglZ [Thermotoga sp.]|nr:MAG: BREX-4 system phosphatase PglZ [Thermotoga sp.]